jgi:ABC-type multidrug transport system ATPase subunit
MMRTIHPFIHFIHPTAQVLWLELTCLQHLVVFARYKGFDNATAQREAMDVLEQLGMQRKAHVPAKALSGGMQRKLSLGIAFVCNPRLVFLDEPSSGMDATARQECWDFLRARREKTVILLTTHYMDEADCLGDRVMVMSAGRAKCCGSGQFLKKAFSCGYMIRTLLPEKDHGDEAKANLVKLIESHLGGRASGVSGTGQELNVTVKMDQAGTFAAMFPELDKKVEEQMLKEWSVAVCSLEEVFLRVASGWTDDGEEHQGKKAVALPQTKRGVVKNHLQIQSMFMRRVHYMKRSWLYLGCETLAPAAYILLIFVIIGAFIDSLLGSGDLQLSMGEYNTQLKAANADFAEVIPVLAIPVGDPFDPDNMFVPRDVGDKANWDVGTLETHGLAKTVTVRGDKYSLEMVTLTPAEYAKDCDNMEVLDDRWDKYQEDVKKAEEEAAAEEAAPKDESEECECECERGERGDDDRRLSFLEEGFSPSRQLLSKFKEPGELAACKLGGIETEADEFKDKGVTDVEVITRGFSCWLQDTRDKEKPAESTYGAIMLYGDDGGHVVLVNTTGVHTLPIMMNVRANALLQKKLPDAQIRVTFSEFARTPKEMGDFLARIYVFISIILMSVGFAFPPPFFVAFIVEEKASGTKGQLLVSGLRGINYWIANYIFDILPWFVALSTLTLIFWTYELELFFETEVLPIFLSAMVAFVVHIVPFAYCLAQLFKDPATAIMSVLIAGILLFVAYLFWIGYMFDDTPTAEGGYRESAEFYTPLLRVHPTFAFSECMWVLQQVHGRFQGSPPDQVKQAEKDKCLEDRADLKNVRWECTYSFWDWDACGGPIYTSLAWGVVMMFAVMALEVLYQTPSAIYGMQKLRDGGPKVTVREEEEDDAVRAEKAAVNSGAKTGPIHVQGVRKTYRSANIRAKPFTAVKDISWACDAGDVFGLLGVNGAGKTTLFQQLSGILVQSEGTVKMAGNNMLSSSGLRRARNVIGYCPQHNPLLSILSVREHIEMFGMLKGLSGKELETARDLWIAAMDLSSHQWKLAGNLSGGNKRKLCVAMAMIGDPEIILLDEPSAGMDPEARRFMWDVIAEIAQTRKQATVVLTTHSMEECEALCNKITVMVNGAFRCYGTHKEVKDLYGQGRQLSVKLETPTKQERTELMKRWTTDGLMAAEEAQPKARASVLALITGPKEDGPSKTISRARLAEWAKGDDEWLSAAVESPVAPFPENTPESQASVPVLSEWYCNAMNAKKLLAWVRDLDSSSEWLAWAGTTFRFKLYGGGTLAELFDAMYKNKARLRMMEYAVSPTSLEQIFHTFAKEQTGASDEMGVYGNEKEKSLEKLFAGVTAAGGAWQAESSAPQPLSAVPSGQTAENVIMTPRENEAEV